MYASALKFCGVMELCGLGFPQDAPLDAPWSEVLDQVKAQRAGLLILVTRGHKPVEAEFALTKGFAPCYEFKNPRTGTIGTLWIKDFTDSSKTTTDLLPQLVIKVNTNQQILDGLDFAGINLRIDSSHRAEYTAPIGPASSPGPPRQPSRLVIDARDWLPIS